MKWFSASDEVKQFCAAMIASPNDWVQGAYCFSNRQHRGIDIWTCSGVFYIKIGGNACLSLADKRAIAKAIAKTSALQIGGHLK